MMKRLCHEPPSAFGDLARPFDRTYPNVLAGLSSALADIHTGIHRVQRHKVASSLADSFCGLARALGRAFADIAAAASNVTARASTFGRCCV